MCWRLVAVAACRGLATRMRKPSRPLWRRQRCQSSLRTAVAAKAERSGSIQGMEDAFACGPWVGLRSRSNVVGVNRTRADLTRKNPGPLTPGTTEEAWTSYTRAMDSL